MTDLLKHPDCNVAEAEARRRIKAMGLTLYDQSPRHWEMNIIDNGGNMVAFTYSILGTDWVVREGRRRATVAGKGRALCKMVAMIEADID